jgi:two-component system KDP operon response regulator KdpE
MALTRVLVVDDEPEIQYFLRSCLSGRGFAVQAAATGTAALAAADRWHPDAVILDLMLPDLDGFEVLKRLRKWTELPVVVVSGRDRDADKVRALDLGADDYVTKPFSVDELLARLRAVLRRSGRGRASPAGKTGFRCGRLQVDFERQYVAVDGAPVQLTPTEYRLLKELTTNAGKLLTHSVLLGRVWGAEYLDEADYLPAFVRRLRKKIEPDPANPCYILTEHRAGYRFASPETFDGQAEGPD